MFAKSTAFEYRCQTLSTARRALIVVLVAALFLVPLTGLTATELFDRGSEAFLYDRPREAATLLEQAIGEDPVNSRAYLYLALSYEQLAMYERAITTLQRAATIPGIDRSQVFFIIGNNYLHLGEAELAESAYTKAIDVSPLFADPYLNRANVRVMQELYPTAVEDYSAVLGLVPQHPQRVEIERMINLLTDHVAQERFRQEEEAARIEEDARQRAAQEAQRVAEEEQQRQAAEDRRRALLDSVLGSLKTATGDTTNMSAGNEDIDDYADEEFDIAD
jgi:tetratricopeptide (TPR) repeat protein